VVPMVLVDPGPFILCLHKPLSYLLLSSIAIRPFLIEREQNMKRQLSYAPDRAALTLTPTQAATVKARIRGSVYVDCKGCWLFRPYASPYSGYPTMQIRGGRYSVRRVVYVLWCKSPPLGLGRVESTCGNRRCVNPEHLVRVDDDAPHRQRIGGRRARREVSLA